MEKASTSQSQSKDINMEMPWPAYSAVFDFQPNLSNEKNFAFACKCCIGAKIIHANKSSAANLRKHLNTLLQGTNTIPRNIVSNMQHKKKLFRNNNSLD